MTMTSTAPPPPKPPQRCSADYDALNQALDALSLRPNDFGVRIDAVRAYLRLGLGGPAADLLGEAGGLPEADSLRAAARRLSGRQVWGKRASLFEANLRVLSERGVDIETIRRAWRESRDRFELFVDAHGVEHVRIRGRDGGGTWLGRRFEDHRAAAARAALPEDFRETMPGPFLFEGIGSGHLLLRVWRETRRTFHSFSAALYIVEVAPEWIGLALHLHDWSACLGDPAVVLFVGRDAGQRFEERIATDWSLGVPRRLLPGRPGGLGEGVEALISRIESRRRTEFCAAREAAEAIYAGRDASWWARRFADALAGKGPPLRILASVSRHTTFLKYSMRDALGAFEKLGCTTRLLTERADHDRIGAMMYVDAIREFRPDLFFVIDHLRTSFGEAVPAHLPVMTWDQDDLPHIFRDENIRRMSPLDVVTGILHLLPIARGAGRPEQFLGSQIATNPEEFGLEDITEAELAPYRCDVSFVSHASQTPAELHAEERARCGDAGLGRVMDAVFEVVMRRPSAPAPDGGMLNDVLSAAERRCGVTIVDACVRDRIRGWYVWRLCDRTFRHEALRWAAEWAESTGRTLRIYGNGWDRHPTLSRFAAGPAENGRPLVAIYRASAINLQLMPGGFIHQRALDGLCAGGFFLTRRTRADRRDARLGPLWQEIRAAGLENGPDVLARGVAPLRERFLDVGRLIGRTEAEAQVTYEFLRANPAWDYPTEVFDGFDEIVFDDRPSFIAAAERFLGDAAARKRIREAMRARVIERYSYPAVTRRFLQFHADYLASSAAMTGRGASAG
ncbi:MAG: hypothetical protein AMXMBFR47_07980 [Planctomycetota bacterium]